MTLGVEAEPKLGRHAETTRHFIDCLFQSCSVSRETGAFEHNPLKELASVIVRVLVRVNNVRAVPGKELRERVNHGLNGGL